MRRREFLLGASGAAGAASMGPGAAVAQETETASPEGTVTGTATSTDSGDGGGGATHTVAMTDDLVFEPSELTVAPGDTVVWENVGGVGHTVTAYGDEIPEEATYFASGGFDSEEAARGEYPEGDIGGGESYEHTFEATGPYEYFCIPHEAAGMVGSVTVQEGAGAGGGAGAPEEADPEEMGVPFQAHYVGAATVLAIVVSLVFTFYVLKYGESPHSGFPKR